MFCSIYYEAGLVQVPKHEIMALRRRKDKTPGFSDHAPVDFFTYNKVAKWNHLK